MSDDNAGKSFIAYQGEPGAFSELACKQYAPQLTPMPCATFEDAFEAVSSGRAAKAMLPIENSLAGRVADIHHLLPGANLHIIAEYFLPVEHHLMVRPGVNMDQVKIVRSHAMALGQCRRFIRDHGLKAEMSGDTAGAARHLAEEGHDDEAVIASSLAAQHYNLDVLAANIEDEAHNTTRFLEMAREPQDADPDDGAVVTSFVFEVRNIPAALYKAMGGFATNGVNMTKLESYQLDGAFTATMFYADIEGHPAHEPVRLALEELSFFSSSLKILGVYKAARVR
ncbi:prephenate dehydratase [Hyphococcus flavus]|uniref:prephenate dehydratase n=1 Tax=Hyphococcus flavus TaxID=1866326 RepID=A0AAE9ZHD8_9PROT|nr:prephenate dehydratase [Hyphococcus flavus]WDI32837.1 prephenate dehydratase [Hyphococcus flavus]